MLTKMPANLNSRALTAQAMYTLLLLCLTCPYALATDVKQAQLILRGDSYVLSADIHYQLSDIATEALQNGVPLFWTLRVKVSEPRHYWLWDKDIVTLTVNYRIQYHALLNMYRVKNEYSGEVDNFSTLSGALDWMSTIRNIPLLARADIAPQTDYVIAVKVDFDCDALPLPLRPAAYINPQWYLSSDWTQWPLKK
jgi:hypothetical protein